MRLFIAFYYGFCCFIHCIGLPVLFLLSFKPKYRKSLKKRFFCPTFLKIPQETLWLHACSFGEVQSLAPLIDLLTPCKQQILITTLTQTGFELAHKLYPKAQIAYLPFESFIPFWCKNINLKSLILFEAELWLMPLVVAKQKNATTMLINARISTRSYPKYLRFKTFYSRLFSLIDKVFCQQNSDKARLQNLGARNIEVLGNLKYLLTPKITQNYDSPKKPLWVIASTHQKNNQIEELLILKAILPLLSPNLSKNPHILFAPRHPERFREVEEILNSCLIEHHFSPLAITSKMGIQNALHSPFILLDTLGELNNLYKLADLVILGGSFLPDIGGHNPIEPAFFQTKLISGPYIFNQKSLFLNLQNYILCDIQDLTLVLSLNASLPRSKITQILNTAQILKTLQEQSKTKEINA